MGLEDLGTVKSGSGKDYRVHWNASDKRVYVGYAGRTYIGDASSANEAMNKAEAWCYNK